MVYHTLADVVVLVHALYAAVVLGGLIAILVGIAYRWAWTRNFWLRCVHALMIAVVVVQAWLGQDCPLTTLERDLRRRGGEVTYPADFIAHWVRELLFVNAPPWVFTLSYSLFGLAVLVTFVLSPPRWPFSESTRV